jgi:hypothetical protein
MNMNFTYQESNNDQLNVFTTLGGARQTRNWSLSDQFNIQKGRNQFNVSANYNHSQSGSLNNFSGVNNVANDIGILGVSDSPFAWGLPRLSFSSITGLSDVTPSSSIGNRAGTNVTWRHPFGRHQVQAGGNDVGERIVVSSPQDGGGGGQVVVGRCGRRAARQHDDGPGAGGGLQKIAAIQMALS